MADGWIKLWRKLSESPMWLEEPFTKGQAWVDLLMLATSADHMSKYKGRDKRYKAGTVHFSLRFLAARWRWSRNKVYRFIERLQKDRMIEYQGRPGNGTIDGTIVGAINDTTDGTTNDTVLIVVNWALYQGGKLKNGTINGTTNDTTNRTQNRTGNGTHPKNDIYPKNDISKEEYGGSDKPPLPGSIEMIRPEIDLVGCPPFEEMPDSGNKRMIPKRVRHLFDGDYDAFRRYMERCRTKSL